MNELKWGDEVEVDKSENGFSGTRVFLHENEDGSCICVSGSDSINDFHFNTAKWQKGDWSPVPEKNIIPFDFSDAEKLIGRPVKSTDTNNIYLIKK